MAVYLFFDESGNLDFSENGSRWFCFGSLTLRDPGPLTAAFARLRYAFLEQGLELECFHAAEDRQAVRNQVFSTLAAVGGFEVDVLVVEKCLTPAELRDPFEFYRHLAHVLMDSVLDRFRDVDEPIVIITDSLPVQRERKALEKAFRTALRESLKGRPFSIVHHNSATHAGLQAVDYCTWAVQRRLRGDERPYELIRCWIRSEWEAFREVHT
ncbi:DUF3800 domain-containing protein [Longimicrobium sp.]|uniref:DUF3800 domain-containing protein n=1 Tax=Longimicrobium sp. TaxID=2029185 RepID=UPI003B3B25CC